MLPQWSNSRRQLRSIAFVLLCALCASEAKLCSPTRIGKQQELDKLRGCTTIVGSLKIVLMEKTNFTSFQDYSFPDLREIRGYLLLYRVRGLTTLAKLFPNLAVIRGQELVVDYALILHDLPNLQEIGLKSLRHIGRGSTRIDRCPHLCYVETINWSKIGTPLHRLDAFGVGDACLSCPTNCSGWCWNEDYCQLQETGHCHPQCIGCNGPSASDCLVCRSYTNDDTCVSICPPNKILHVSSGHCITPSQCSTILKQKGRVVEGQCLDFCPWGYMEMPGEKPSCSYCGNDCKKEIVDNITVDSISSAQELRGYTHLNGYIHIKITSKSMAVEMEENLGMIEEITGHLKIYRSPYITSLEFLKRLKVIEGRYLDNNRYALVVYENINLQKLWPWEDFDLKIKRGTLSFHYNAQLCYAEIEKLADMTGLVNTFTNTDVSELSNGGKAICGHVNLFEKITGYSSTKVNITWKEFTVKSERAHLIGYFLYYIKDSLGNVTIYDGQDECSATGWDSVFVTTNSYQIVELKPYTHYAYYIKTYTTNVSVGGQTEISRFRTLTSHPTEPLEFAANSSSSDSISIIWKPPIAPNGPLDFYRIGTFLLEDDRAFLSRRNYCKFPHREPIKKTATHPITKNSSCCNLDNTLEADESCENLDPYSPPYELPLGNFTKIHPSDLKGAKFTIEHLDHFSQYMITLQACNNGTYYNDEKHKNETLQCSATVVTYQRTLRKVDADDISRISVEVSDYVVHLSWSPPNKPNSAVVAYQIHCLRADLANVVPVRDCITHEEFVENNFLFSFRLPPGVYKVRVKAISLAGDGRFIESEEFEIEEESGNVHPAIVIVPTVLVTSMIVGLMYYYYYRQKNKFGNLHLIADINPDYAGPVYVEDEWELERNDIEIFKELGQGTFGMVYQGLIKSKNLPCALKTVNEHANIQDRIVFLNEASVMKSFSDAHHVVKLLGVVSKGDPPLVVMELMERGDLKSSLRKSRDSSTSITSAEMYRMAAEIADGMLYLSARKYVHRDLAARNCMVAADHTVKIGDFGMTRDIYETDYYRKESRGLMPVRWMAPESLADGVFTSDSDVWSYGVVLWEMATLAEQPYQGLANEQVLQFVIAQGTLERPPECPDVLYEIMVVCWKWRPNQRPLFSDIVEKLESSVGQDFRLVSFYHSAAGEEFRRNMDSKKRVYNTPAMAVPLNRQRPIHWSTGEDNISLYSSMEDNPTPLLSTYQNQNRRNSHSDSSYH